LDGTPAEQEGFPSRHLRHRHIPGQILEMSSGLLLLLHEPKHERQYGYHKQNDEPENQPGSEVAVSTQERGKFKKGKSHAKENPRNSLWLPLKGKADTQITMIFYAHKS
jgi:hypothetical protein